MSNEDRIVLNSIISSFCKLMIKYNKNIKLDYNVINYVYNTVNNHFLASGKRFRIFKDYQTFRSIFMNDLIANHLASMDSTYNCVFNASQEQCYKFLEYFGNESEYSIICYDLIHDHFAGHIFKLEYYEKVKKTLKSINQPVDDNGVVVAKSGPTEHLIIEPVEQDVKVPLHTNSKILIIDENDIPIIDEIIYSSNEGIAIRKILNK